MLMTDDLRPSSPISPWHPGNLTDGVVFSFYFGGGGGGSHEIRAQFGIRLRIFSAISETLELHDFIITFQPNFELYYTVS